MGIKKLIKKTNEYIKIRKPANYIIKSNLLKNRYTTDGIIWTVDETIFNSKTRLFVVVNLKTRAILGYITSNYCLTDDLILELYKEILKNNKFNNTPYFINTTPSFVHSDMEEAFHSEKVQEFLGKQKIYISITEGEKNQNQVSESINNRIKSLVSEILLKNPNSKAYREFSNALPEKLKRINKKERYNNKKFRERLFKSRLFTSNSIKVIEEAITKYNSGDFTKGISREEAQYYDRFIKDRTIDNTRLVKSDHHLASLIKHDNIVSITEARTKLIEILNSDLKTEEKISELLTIVVLRQENSDKLIQQGFVGLTIQNFELLKNNQELQNKVDRIQRENEEISRSLNELLETEREIQQQRLKRKNRKRLPKKDPITEEIYEFLIERSYRIQNETYQGARLRLALSLLVITGVRISELLFIKVDQLSNLFEKSWIRIDRMKRGPSSHKAFLTRKGKAILKNRSRDFEIIQYSKKNDCYIFTPQYSKNPLNREVFNKIINKFLKESVKEFPDQPNLKSHSFRIGFITELWRDTGDIEFVRQAIGHAKVNTTSSYVENLSDEERRIRMEKVNSPKDLIIKSDDSP